MAAPTARLERLQKERGQTRHPVRWGQKAVGITMEASATVALLFFCALEIAQNGYRRLRPARPGVGARARDCGVRFARSSGFPPLKRFRLPIFRLQSFFPARF